MRHAWTLLLTAALIPGAARAAIELSLEENRAQRGNIGFIDMQRVFKLFPETIRARENFQEVVRQAEEQLNLRKAEILRLRLSLPGLRLNLGLLKKRLKEAEAQSRASAPPAAPPTAPPSLSSHSDHPKEGTVPQSGTTASAPSPSAEPVPPPSTAPMRADASSDGSQDARPPASTATVLNALPGISTAPLTAPSRAHASSDGSPDARPPALTAPASGSAAPTPAQETAMAPPVELKAMRKGLQEAEKKLSAAKDRLAELEGGLKEQEASAERSLMDLESRRTEILLGRIHTAIRDVARLEGISIVVDKANILYGHNAVDLTEKVLARLKGP